MPTFSFGLSFWDSPYYDYYSSPSVVYTEPAVVYGGSTYYTQPGTTYVETPPPTYVQEGTTYVDTQVESQQVVPPSTTLAPPTTAAQPPPEGEQAQQVKEPDPRVIAAVSRGNEHFGAGRYIEARQAYGEAVAVDDTDGVAKLLYGLASFAAGDFGVAASSTRQALDATPDLIWYPFNVKALYRDQNKFQEHVANLANHVSGRPGDTDAHFLLGYMWYSSGDAQNAKTVFGTLATNNPADQLFMALRDASTKALDAMSREQKP